jgi:hypothetical protein
MLPELTKQLEQFLKTAETRRLEFKSGMNAEEKKENAIDFQSKILNILDYVYTNDPIGQAGGHYPRPNQCEKVDDYLTRIQRDRLLDEKTKIFLLYCFGVNKKYNEAISYILSKVKHERPNEFGQDVDPVIKGKFSTTYSTKPIKTNPDGSIEMPGLKVAPGASVKIIGMNFVGDGGVLSIDSLELVAGKFEGDMIVLKYGEKRLYKDWSSDCVKICREIIDYLYKPSNFAPDFKLSSE